MLRSLVDDALELTIAFPGTVVRTLLTPKKVMGEGADQRYASPEIFLVPALLCYWLAVGLADQIGIGQQRGIPFPDLGDVAGTIIWLVIVLASLRALLVRGLRIASLAPPRAIGLLSLPFSVGLVFYAVLIFVMVQFPESAVATATALDSGFEQLQQTWPANTVWVHAIDMVSAIPVLLAGTWALFNVIRVGFGVTRARAIAATLTSVVLFLALTVPYISLIGRMQRHVICLVGGG